jgi:hypothetical protein
VTQSENRQSLAFAVTSLLVLATTFALPSKAADIAKAQEHAASVQRAQTAGEFERGLTTELQKENRDDSWASRQESELRASYKSSSDLPQNGLSSIECRYSKCVIQFRVDANSTPNDAIAQLNAITRWISTGQACGYTLIPVGNTGALQDDVRIFLNCPR